MGQHTDESWATARARAIKAAEDVVRVAYGEPGQRCKTLPSALGELRDALHDLGYVQGVR